MDKDTLKQDIEAIVAAIFSDKEQAGQVQKTQEALSESAETIEILTQSLEAKVTELEEANTSSEAVTAEKDTKISELTTELEAAQLKVTELEASLVETKETLENIEKDQVAEARMAELKEEKVAILSDLETQTAKVKELTDEEFASYKTDRVELRNAVAAELEAASKAAASQESNEEIVLEEGAASEEDVLTPAAEITPGQSMAAAMNFESKPSEDMLAKYAKMGAALAAGMTKSDK